MKLKKVLSILLAFVLVLSMAGCGSSSNSGNVEDAKADTTKAADKNDSASSSSSSDDTVAAPAADEKITIELWSQFSDPNSTDGNYIAFYRALDSIKEDMPNVIINHNGSEGEAYKVKLKTAMAANELPDVFFNWGAGTTQPYVESDLILPIDDYISDHTKENVLGGTLGNFTFGGKIYGLPYSVAVASLYVNTELFDQYGVKIPETMEEMQTAIDIFTQNDITPISLGEKDLWPGLMTFGIMAIRMAGADNFNAAMAKEGRFDTPEMIQAATILQGMANDGAFGPSAMGTTYGDSVAAFKQGKAAMMFMGSWLNGDIQADDSIAKDKVKVIKFPVIEGGSDNINEFHGGAGETFLINADTEYPEVAVQVVEYITEKMSKEQYLAGSGMPAWKADITSADTSNMNPLSLQIADLTADATGYVYWLDVISSPADADTILNEIARLIVNDVTPEEFCGNLQKMNE